MNAETKNTLFDNSKKLIIEDHPECEGEEFYIFVYNAINIKRDVFDALSFITSNICQVLSTEIKDSDKIRRKINWYRKDLECIQIYSDEEVFAIATNKNYATKIIENNLFNQNYS
jgi:hypothetical protein